MFSLKIQSVGYERELLNLRSMVLRQALGTHVVEAADFASAVQIARGAERIDILLLCHTVPAPDQQKIIEVAREHHGNIPALSIFPGVIVPDTAGTPVSNDPEELIAAVRKVLDFRNQTVRDRRAL